MTKRKGLVGFIALLFLLLFSLSAWAQFESAVEGTVTDPSGAVVPDATVIARDVETGITRTVQTSTAGNYYISSLPAHLFEITVSAKGFKTTVQQNIRLEGKQVKAVNVTLELGTATSEVTVTAAPPPVETSEARVSSQINERRVENLPIVGRNFYSLVVLTAGIIGLPAGGGQAYAQASGDIFASEYGVNIQANGQRPESNSYLIDGASANGSPRGGVTNVNPNADSVQELRVSINNFSAQYGRNASSVTNVVTKSGTNDVHGTLGYFHTDNHLTAGNIFQPKSVARADGTLDRIPVFQRNEGNWSIGGPIRKDHTFFFGSMDFLRSGIGNTTAATVLAPDFINYMQTNYADGISTYIAKTFLPVGTVTGVASTVQDILPSGTTCTGSETVTTPIGDMPCDMAVTNYISSSYTTLHNGLQWNIRLDQNFGSGNNRLYGNWYRTSRQATFSTSIYPAFTMPEPEYSDYLNLNFTHIFSPTLLYEGGLTMTRVRGDVDLSGSHPEIPQINVPGITSYGMGFSGPTFMQTNGEWRNVLSWNRGKHAFKFGGNLGHDMGWGGGSEFAGEYSRYFYNFQTMWDFALSNPYQESHYGFNPTTGEQISYNFTPKFQRFGLFANDDWKATRNLTLNLGLRYEVFQVPGYNGKQTMFSRFVPGSGSDFTSRISDGSIIQGAPLLGADKNNFAPRVGFAWDPTGKGRMAIRGGAGIFYDRPAGQFFHDCCVQLPMFATVTASTFIAGPQPVYGLGTSSVAPYGYPPMTGITAGLDSHGGLISAKADIDPWDPYLRTQYAENWFIGMQYAFTNNWVLEGNYVGSAGRKMYQGYDVNRFDGDLLGPVVQTGTNTEGAPVYGVQLDRLNSSFGGIDFGQSNGTSYYKGGNFSVKKRFSRGLDFQAAYTVGKAIDTASSFGTGLNMVDMSNLNLNRGLSDFDVRHKLAASFVYDLPGPKTGFMSKLAGGWQAGGVVILQKGVPYSVYCSLSFEPVYDKDATDPTRQVIGNDGCDYNADGHNYDYPMMPSFGTFKSGNKQSFLSGIFSASDFPAPTTGSEGDLGRNSYVGPGYINTDFNIVKNTKIPWLWKDEAASIQLRGEFFNLFNNVNLQNPTGDMASGTFGRSTAVYPARNIQFGVKIIF
jgi:hypothetical protein